MTRKPHILITNDDGIYAPGIKHLWNSLKEIAEITVVAPLGEQSAIALAQTLRSPLHIEKINWHSSSAKVWSVSGTPADCVKLALNTILPHPPDLILSGINRGSNSGRNVLYSGTVAAVIEGVLHGIPGIAFSLENYFEPQFHLVEKFIPSLMQYVLENPLPQGTLLNVNFPDTAKGVKGMKMTRQGKGYWGENIEKRSHPSEMENYYWLGSKLTQFEEEEDSDIFWLQKGYATAVPIYIDELTHQAHFRSQKDHFERCLNPSLEERVQIDLYSQKNPNLIH